MIDIMCYKVVQMFNGGSLPHVINNNI